ACSWIWPLPSRRSMKAFLPWPRRAAIRPATRWRESVSAPGASPSCSARTAAISSPSESLGWSEGSALIGREPSGPSGLLDFGDFEFFLRAARRLDGDDVVPLLA